MSKYWSTSRLKDFRDRSRISSGRRLYDCATLKRRRRLPASVLTRGRARSASCLVDRERRVELTWSWEERASGFPVQRILWRKLSECCSYSWRSVGQPSSSRTSDIWSNFRRPETVRRAKFSTFWRRCMFFSDPFPKTARQYRTCERTRALTNIGSRSVGIWWRTWDSPMRIPLHFLTRADTWESQVRYLSNTTPRFLTVGPSRIVSSRNRMEIGSRSRQFWREPKRMSSVFSSVDLQTVGVEPGVQRFNDLLHGSNELGEGVFFAGQ